MSLSWSNLRKKLFIAEASVIIQLNASVWNESIQDMREDDDFIIISLTIADALNKINESFADSGLFFIRESQEKHLLSCF